MLRIIKTYVEPNGGDEGSHEVSPETAKRYLEEKGYYSPGTVDAILAKGEKTTLRTDFAVYDFC